jgi:hypothetical protein
MIPVRGEEDGPRCARALVRFLIASGVLGALGGLGAVDAAYADAATLADAVATPAPESEGTAGCHDIAFDGSVLERLAGTPPHVLTLDLSRVAGDPSADAVLVLTDRHSAPGESIALTGHVRGRADSRVNLRLDGDALQLLVTGAAAGPFTVRQRQDGRHSLCMGPEDPAAGHSIARPPVPPRPEPAPVLGAAPVLEHRLEGRRRNAGPEGEPK